MPARENMVIYEQLLDQDLRRAMNEGSRYFEERSAVQDALRKVTGRLRDLGISYAVAGGMALFAHGFRRFTEDVDILVSGEDLKMIHHELEGLGYVHPFKGSRNLRDAETGVRIEFLVTGQFPGDGKPKPVAFPEPSAAALERDGVQYLNLPTLIELKLASGMTSLGRVKDLADVQELIKLLTLPDDFAEKLDPYVREKYWELWTAVVQTGRRFALAWQSALPTAKTQTFDQIIAILQQEAEFLKALRADGVKVALLPGMTADHAYFVTNDPEIARKYGMHDEAEYEPGVIPETEAE